MTLSAIADVPATDADSVCLLRQHQEQLSDLKGELGEIHSILLSLNLDDRNELCVRQAEMERAIFDSSLKIKKALHTREHTSSTTEGKGLRLPKLEIPMFDGHVFGWKTFWEQFSISVHGHSDLSNSEKLVYLQQALKVGSAKHVIEGLSRSGDCYAEAIECLQSHYDHPRLYSSNAS